MFIERKLNSLGEIELWRCDWENNEGKPARKVFFEKIGIEQSLEKKNNESMKKTPAICWSYGRTLGNIAVFTSSVLGSFPAEAGNNAELPCDFVDAGKFRHGVNRWWCRTHQSHWGTKADLESAEKSNIMLCSNHDQLMNYVVSPQEIDLNEFEEFGIWCSLPRALSSCTIKRRPPRIHIHIRKNSKEEKIFDGDVQAFTLRYTGGLGLFQNSDICYVNITPPAAFEFVTGLENDRKMDCINCSHCGYPHLDLGEFAERPHRKHFCANCGRDSTWSKDPIVSTPLKPLHDKFNQANNYELPDRKLNLDEYAGCGFDIWASTPAVIWTANRPQEKGIHVHVYKGSNRIVDDTFCDVVLKGKSLSRDDLLQQMISRTII